MEIFDRYISCVKKFSLRWFLIIQGPQGLSAHFEMALTGRKNVAISKLMVASNSQLGYNFKHMVSPLPQLPHVLQKPLRKRVEIGHSIPMTNILVICEVTEARV